MADTFEIAANNKDTAGMPRNFSEEFTKKLELKNNAIWS
jgi:hypothetical protein